VGASTGTCLESDSAAPDNLAGRLDSRGSPYGATIFKIRLERGDERHVQSPLARRSRVT